MMSQQNLSHFRIISWSIRSIPDRKSGEGESSPILLSGHHANIEKWRREQSILRTMERRPDLLKESNLTDKEKKWIRQVKRERKEAEKMK